MLKCPFKVVTFLFLLTGCFQACNISRSEHNNLSSTDTLIRFTNPIAESAQDPWIIKKDSFYYYCHTDKWNRLCVSKSRFLHKLGEDKVVWTTPDTGWNRNTVWAPELHSYNNKWYIYYAAGLSGPPFIYQRSGVLESLTDDPQGAYIDKGILNTGEDPNDPTGTIWAIDFTISVINGKLYGAWSGWERNADTDKTSQNIYIAEMSNPWTVSSERVKISAPDQSWETGGPLDLNEGPQFLKHNGHIFIIYSTRESWTPEYRLGQLTLKDSTAALNSANWVKSGPVFQGTSDVVGTGHASFTTSMNGREWWIFYHSKKSYKPGWDRDLRLQKFTWNKDGSPNFGVPKKAGDTISYWMSKSLLPVY